MEETKAAVSLIHIAKTALVNLDFLSSVPKALQVVLPKVDQEPTVELIASLITALTCKATRTQIVKTLLHKEPSLLNHMVLVANALWVPYIPREPLEDQAHTALNTNVLQTETDSIFRLSLEAKLSLAQDPANSLLMDTTVLLPAPNQINTVPELVRNTAEEDAWVKEPAKMENAPVFQAGEAMIAVRELVHA
jgi:hypothetical protein